MSTKGRPHNSTMLTRAGMSPKKKNTTAHGVITFHTPFLVGLLKSEDCRADVRANVRADVRAPTDRRGSPSLRTRSPGKRVSAGKRAEEASPSVPQPGAKRDWLSHTSLRQLKAKMEAENQQAKEIIQPLLDTENGLVKDLERFLSQRDVAELRRKELLHKRWTERVWFPLQRRVEEHMSSCSPAAVKRLPSLYSHDLHHCNTKLSTADLKDPSSLQLHEGLKEKRTAGSCEAGCKYTRTQVEKLPQRDPPLLESVTPWTDILRQASSNHPVTASRFPPVGDKTEGKRSSRCVSSRLDTIPYHISATATPHGRCHQTGCWLHRYQPQPASLQQLPSSPTSK